MSFVALTKYAKWNKWLSLHPIINALNIYKAFLYLLIFLKTTKTIETVSVHILVDLSVTEIFINYSFIRKHYLSTYKLSRSMLVYNIDDISNKDSQISEIVDIVL